jgi:hypothetical protein
MVQFVLAALHNGGSPYLRWHLDVLRVCAMLLLRPHLIPARIRRAAAHVTRGDVTPGH